MRAVQATGATMGDPNNAAEPKRRADAALAAAPRSAPARSASDRWLHRCAFILSLMIVLAGALDSLSTELALATGFAREANPLVRAVQEAIGVWWILPKMALHGALAWLVTWRPTWFTIGVMSLVTMLTFAAAANNFMIFADIMRGPHG